MTRYASCGTRGYARPLQKFRGRMLGGSLGSARGASTKRRLGRRPEVRPTKHLAFQHFQPVNVPLDGTRTPGAG